MTLSTSLLVLSLAAFGAIGYFLRTISRQRTVELLAVVAGVATLPLLGFGVAVLPNLVLANLPMLVSASMIAGSLVRGRAQTEQRLNKLEVAGTLLVLSLSGFFLLALGMFFVGQAGTSSSAALATFTGVAFFVAGAFGLRSAVNLALAPR
jgi:hypothetical protein